MYLYPHNASVEATVLTLHQEKVKLVIVRRLAPLPYVAWIAHHRLG